MWSRQAPRMHQPRPVDTLSPTLSPTSTLFLAIISSFHNSKTQILSSLLSFLRTVLKNGAFKSASSFSKPLSRLRFEW